jgi:hypothetical protein
MVSCQVIGYKQHHMGAAGDWSTAAPPQGKSGRIRFQDQVPDQYWGGGHFPVSVLSQIQKLREFVRPI